MGANRYLRGLLVQSVIARAVRTGQLAHGVLHGAEGTARKERGAHRRRAETGAGVVRHAPNEYTME